jgi:saccharopine dehydrogenase-like NADP-dependent oxidoreductase
MRQVTVLGGAGAMARAVLHDLLETAEDMQIIVADHNEAGARERVEALNDPRLVPAFCDAADAASLREACRGSDVIINCINAGNLVACQQAAVDVGAHYLDLGSWPEETQIQLSLGPLFEKAGRVAILGAGSAPGITNVMASAVVAHLDTLDSLHVKLAKTYASTSNLPLNPPYALSTILEELTCPATIVQDGRLTQVPAQSAPEVLICPEPMGEVEIMHVIHPEPFTFFQSFAEKGLRDATFKIGLPKELLQRLRFLLSLGLGEDRDVPVDGARVNLKKLLLDLAASFRSEVIEPGNPPRDYSYTLVVAQGKQSGRPLEIRAELFSPPQQRWGLSTGTVRTGVPASVIAQMLMRGEIATPGCFTPEQCVPPRPFFTYLAQRDLRVYLIQREAGFDQP